MKSSIAELQRQTHAALCNDTDDAGRARCFAELEAEYRALLLQCRGQRMHAGMRRAAVYQASLGASAVLSDGASLLHHAFEEQLRASVVEKDLVCDLLLDAGKLASLSDNGQAALALWEEALLCSPLREATQAYLALEGSVRELLRRFPLVCRGGWATKLPVPINMRPDPDGLTVWLCDPIGRKIRQFTAAGVLLREHIFAEQGPLDVLPLGEGRCLVAEQTQGALVLFESDGAVSRRICVSMLTGNSACVPYRLCRMDDRMVMVCKDAGGMRTLWLLDDVEGAMPSAVFVQALDGSDVLDGVGTAVYYESQNDCLLHRMMAGAPLSEPAFETSAFGIPQGICGNDEATFILTREYLLVYVRGTFSYAINLRCELGLPPGLWRAVCLRSDEAGHLILLVLDARSGCVIVFQVHS